MKYMLQVNICPVLVESLFMKVPMKLRHSVGAIQETSTVLLAALL